jgi:hypothetical protein
LAGALVTLAQWVPGQGAPVSTRRLREPRVSAAPARSAHSALSISSEAATRSVITGAEGRFVFKDIVPGAYGLEASADGYVTQTLAAGQTVGSIAMRLTPTGSVEGHVREVDGKPVSGVPVFLCGYAYAPGGKLYITYVAGAVITDDRGVYRIFWAAPGKYYLAAGGYTFDWPISQRERRAFTYYPSGADPSKAEAIEIQPGGERTVDWVLPERQSLRIRAQLIDSKTGRPPANVHAIVSPKTPLGYSEDLSGDQARYDHVSGLLEVSDLPSGTYEIRTHSEASTENLNTVSKIVRVTNTDVEGVILDAAEMLPAAFPPVRGRIRIAGGEKLESYEDLQVVVHAEGEPIVSQNFSVDVESDGTFSISVSSDPDDEVIKSGDEYRLSVEKLPEGWYVQEVKLGRIDALNAAVRFSAPEELEITLSPKAGQISGLVNGADGRPAAGVGVILIPTRLSNRSELYRGARTDRNGGFTISSIAPGDYTVCPAETATVFAFFDPAVLKRFEPNCRPVNVKESSQQSVTVTLPPAGVKP